MFDILHRVGMKASLDKVYQALATPEGVAGWWTTETTGDTKVGGMITFRFTDETGRELGVFDMKIRELRSNARVVWEVVKGPPEWVGTQVRSSSSRKMTTPWCCSSTKGGGNRPSSCTTAVPSGACSCRA